MVDASYEVLENIRDAVNGYASCFGFTQAKAEFFTTTKDGQFFQWEWDKPEVEASDRWGSRVEVRILRLPADGLNVYVTLNGSGRRSLEQAKVVSRIYADAVRIADLANERLGKVKFPEAQP